MWGGDFCAATPISIHAPREGGDGYQMHCVAEKLVISIHAPCEGGDLERQGQQ